MLLLCSYSDWSYLRVYAHLHSATTISKNGWFWGTAIYTTEKKHTKLWVFAHSDFSVSSVHAQHVAILCMHSHRSRVTWLKPGIVPKSRERAFILQKLLQFLPMFTKKQHSKGGFFLFGYCFCVCWYLLGNFYLNHGMWRKKN